MNTTNFPSTEKWLKSMFQANLEAVHNLCWYLHSGFDIPTTILSFPPTCVEMRMVGVWLNCIADFNMKYSYSQDVPGTLVISLKDQKTSVNEVRISGEIPVEIPRGCELVNEIMAFKKFLSLPKITQS